MKKSMRKTAITRSILERVLRTYPDLGGVRRFHQFKRGAENESFKVATTRSKLLVLKFYVSGRREDSEIEFELSFIDFLRVEGIPAVGFYRNSLGQAVSRVNLPEKGDRQVVVYDYLGGKTVGQPNVYQMRSVFELLSRIHRASRDYETDLVKRTWTVLDNQQEIEAELPSLLSLLDLPKEESEGLIEEVSFNLQKVNKASKLLEEKLVVHGDLCPANIKFKGDKVLGIFDFDECEFASPLLDIGVTLAELYFPKVGLKELVTTFLEIYQRHNSLSPSAIKLLPTMMNMRYTQMLYWALKHKSRGWSMPWWKKEALRAISGIKRTKEW